MNKPEWDRYLKLLLKWNKAYNLTSITDSEEIRIKHFEDSLAPLPFLSHRCRLLDIGTGGGFPGIPLKIERPDLNIILLDSRQKKIAFCEAVIRELKLEGIEAVWGRACPPVVGRAQDPKKVSSLETFDTVLSRGAFAIEKFLFLARPFLKRGGLAIAMKGSEWKKEYCVDPQWRMEKVHNYELSKGYGKRTLLLFRQC